MYAGFIENTQQQKGTGPKKNNIKVHGLEKTKTSLVPYQAMQFTLILINASNSNLNGNNGR